jgi:hypothetical protein
VLRRGKSNLSFLQLSVMITGSGRLNVASKTTFDALAVTVDTGEESEGEEVHEVHEVAPLPETFVSCLLSKDKQRSSVAHAFFSSSQLELKPSKSAIKKAQKLARAEKRQRQKALARPQTGVSTSPENSVASAEVTPSREPIPLPELSEPSNLNDSYILPAVAPNEESVMKEKASAEVNGMAPGVMTSSSPTPPAVPEAPSSFEPSLTAPLVTEKPSTKPMTLPLHEETSAKDAEKVKKRQSFLTRALWTLIMLSGFIGM